MSLLILIPVYNEAGRIGPLLQQLETYGQQILVVNDGSTDDTVAELQYPGVQVLHHPVNLGKGAALKTGFAYVIEHNYDYVLTMDGDGQHDPADLPRFLAQEKQDQHDLVLGCRMDDTQDMPLLRYLTNQLMSLLISWVIGYRIRDTQCGYRLIKVTVLRQLQLQSNNFDLESEILYKACRGGFRIAEVPVKTIYGTEKSKIRKGRDTFRFFKLMVQLLFFS